MKTDDDRALCSQLTDQLGAMSAVGFGEFVKSRKDGARYSLERDEAYSIVNTSALLRIATHSGVDLHGVNLPAWERKLKSQLRKHTANLRTRAPAENKVYDAYRASQILRAIDDEPARKVLKKWLLQYATRSLSDARYEPSVFIVYLALTALDEYAPQETVLHHLLEFFLSRAIACARASDGTADSVDLALAVAVVDRSRLRPEMIRAAISLLVDTAREGQHWRNLQPVVRANAGKTFGCSSLEACVALLRGTHNSGLYSRLRAPLLSHLRWLEEQWVSEDRWIRSDLYRSEYTRETWFNCVVYEFLHALHTRADETLQASLQTKYKAREVDGEENKDWFRVESLVLGGQERKALRRFVGPDFGEPPSPLKANTVILFGPPGTSKTTTAETMAIETGWPFIELGVADFLGLGIDRVFERASTIFEDLTLLRNVVVLLDEVENVFADRGNENVDTLQKFLTGALLPPLQRVSKRKSIILVIATNYIDNFDRAITRPGRIDLILPVGPPNKAKRCELLQKAVGLRPSVARQLADRLDNRTTIHEIMLFKKLRVPTKGKPDRIADELMRKWTKWVGATKPTASGHDASGHDASGHDGRQISVDDLKIFNVQKAKRRLR